MLSVFTTIIAIYLIITLAASGIMEAISSIFKLRGLYLERAVKQMLGANKDSSSTRGLLLRLFDTLCSLFSKNKVEEFPLLYQNFLKSSSIMALKGPQLFIAGIPLNFGQYLLGRNLPSYIQSSSFFHGLMEALGIQKLDKGTIQVAIENFEGTPSEELLKIFLEKSETDSNGSGDKEFSIEVFQKEVEQWFTSVVDRTSGWYKRNTQIWLFLIGLGFVITNNLDAFMIYEQAKKNQVLQLTTTEFANSLLEVDSEEWMKGYSAYREKEIYKNLKEKKLLIDLDSVSKTSSGGVADSGNHDSTIQKFSKRINKMLADTSQVDPITERANSILSILKKEGEGEKKKSSFSTIIGYILSALAISLGAPFWFDLLKYIMQIRFTGKLPSTSVEKKNETS